MGFQSRLPFLVYHDVCHNPRSLYDIDVAEFIRHLDLIKQSGWSTVTLQAFLAWQSGGGTLASQALVLTFDDGYVSHCETVLPLLVKRDLAATFFVSVGFVGQEGYLSWDQIVRMDMEGMEVGSHGLSHLPLSYMSAAALERELQLSRSILEEHLGHPVYFLSVPRGCYSRRVRDFAIQAGYRAVCTSKITFNHRSSDPRDLGRIWIRGGRDIEALLEGRRSRFILQRSMQAGRELAKASMGYSLYNRLRLRLLGERAGEVELE